MSAAKKSKVVIDRDWYKKKTTEEQRGSRLVNLVEQGAVAKLEDLPDFLKPADVAEKLKCHPREAGDLMRAQIIRSVMHRRRRVTTVEWLADYMRNVLRGHG